MQEENEILYRDIWYGEIINKTKEDLKRKIEDESEKDKLLKVVDLLKIGDFEAKKILIKIMNESKSYSILNLAIRVFCSVATHEDISNVENLKFLEDAEEEVIEVFVTGIETTLSYEPIPYFLALLETWDDTNLGETIRYNLEYILGDEDIEYESCDIEDIVECFQKKILKLGNSNEYYYENKPAFIGELTKLLMDAVLLSRAEKRELEVDSIPTMLSIWSGIKCPVDYYTVVDDDKLKEVIDYVTSLSKMNWKHGKKYFYGHEVK